MQLADALSGIRSRPQDWSIPLPGRRPKLDAGGRIVGVEEPGSRLEAIAVELVRLVHAGDAEGVGDLAGLVGAKAIREDDLRDEPTSVQESAASELVRLVRSGNAQALEELAVVLKAQARWNGRIAALEALVRQGKPLEGPRTPLAMAMVADAWRFGWFAAPDPWLLEGGEPNVEAFRESVQALDERLAGAREAGTELPMTDCLPEERTVWGLLSGPGGHSPSPTERGLERRGTARGEHGRKWKRDLKRFMQRGNGMAECIDRWALDTLRLGDDWPPEGYAPPEDAGG